MAKAIESVRRALKIINLLGESPDGMRLTDIAKTLDLPKGSIYRVLATLASEDYVKKDPDNSRYYLGISILRLQGTVAGRSNLVQVAIPHMNRLSLKLHETVHLAVLDQHRVVYLESRRPERSFSPYPSLGHVAPAHCTALGKVLLAHVSAEEGGDIILSGDELEPRTPNTITNIAALKEELDRTRRRGYAVDNEEQDIGVRCVAGPIRDHRNCVIAALSVSAPSGRLPASQDSVVAHEVLATCRAISQELGATHFQAD